ncbi:MAG TPA: MarR family transcriptional regulator [Cellvibrio sp.]|nr:MarR family transcriptional regulator [Cellvibrio sp.]
MATAFFDDLIHAPNRLKICALLAPVTSLEFVTLCEQLGVSDSVLSKHIKSLDDAGYVVINKKTSEGRQRTWLSLSPKGRKAFNGHVAALKEIVG